ncbi:MAG: class I adenylate-forming enzyme family protein [Desulfobacterales bacterium]|nr:class I adenylate-forming enzyme family protein [Desulfobacterales bacterium]
MAKTTRFTAEMNEYWEPGTLSDYWERNATLFPAKEAIVDARTRLTWPEANLWINRLALGLIDLGIQQDEMIVVQLPNSVELHLLVVACEKAGVLCMPAARTLRAREMTQLLGENDAVGIVIPWKFRDFDYYQMVKAIRPDLPGLRHVFVVGDTVPQDVISIKEILGHPLEKKYSQNVLQQRKCPGNEVSLVIPTTGTTGFPKLVETPFYPLLCSNRWRLKAYNLTPKDVFVAFSPAVSGVNAPVYAAAPQSGGKIVMMEHFDAQEALSLIEKERITVIAAVPTMLQQMLELPDLDKYDLSSVRLIESAGAPLAYHVGQAAEKRFNCPVMHRYGSQDAGAIAQHQLDEPQDIRLRTLGKPCIPGAQVKLLDEEGKEVKRGQIGEILAKGPQLFSGYYRNPEATREAWTDDGWFKTGDLAKFDDQGYLILTGRKKDVIIRGGQNIYPVEIEKILLTHPKIKDVAVVAMPDPIMGQRACAFVVSEPGEAVSLEEVVSFMKDKGAAAYKFPEKVNAIDKLPMVGDSQKVDKKLLQRTLTGEFQINEN